MFISAQHARMEVVLTHLSVVCNTWCVLFLGITFNTRSVLSRTWNNTYRVLIQSVKQLTPCVESTHGVSCLNSPDQHAARVVLLAGFSSQCVLFQILMSTHGVSCLNSPDQHAARVVLLAGFNPQCVLFQNLMSTHGASCLTHHFNTRHVLFYLLDLTHSACCSRT